MHVAAPAILSRDARRRFVATLAAAATALGVMTAAAVPARAAPDAEDYAKALAAIAAIAIIAHAAKDNRRPAPAPAPVPVGPGWGHGGHWGNPGHGHGWTPPRPGPRPLPAACAITFPGHRGPQVVYAEPCLRRSGIDGPFPRACRQEVRMQGRAVTVYSAACLTNAGYRHEPGRGQPPHRGPHHKHGGANR